MAIKVEYALRPCAGVGFAGYLRKGRFKGIVRGDLVWCLSKPTYVDLYLSGISGLSVGIRTPNWIPVSGTLDAFSGAQLTGHSTINLSDLQINNTLQPWLRFSGIAAANLAATLTITQVAAIAYALYDPFYSHKIVLITGLGAGFGVAPPAELSRLFSALDIEVTWTGEVLLFFETLFDVGPLRQRLNSQGKDTQERGWRNLLDRYRKQQ
jgi:hypothetical protein